MRRVVAERMPGIVSDMLAEKATLTQKMSDGGVVVKSTSASDVAEATKRMTSFWKEWAKAHGADGVAGLATVRTAIGR